MDGNFNRICSGAAVLLVLLSLSMGCGDDTGSSGDGDGDGDGDSGAVSGDPECIGTWTGYRLSELADSTTSGVGACSSATDVETICNEGPFVTGRAYPAPDRDGRDPCTPWLFATSVAVDPGGT